MAIAATAVWEVRSTGSDTNGGAFDPGVASPGTDFSVQDAAQFAYTDLVIDATTNTKITSAAHPFDSTSPGNVINITGGTGFTTGWYEVLSVSGVVATLDRAVGTTSSTGGTGNLGGGLATPGKAAGLWVASNTMYIKQATYNMANSASVAGGYINLTVAGSDKLPNKIVGYNTNRTLTNTDTPPILQPSAANMNCIRNFSGGVCVVYNIKCANGNSQGGCTGFFEDNAAMLFENCIADGLATGFSNGFAGCKYFNCYAHSCDTGFALQQVASLLVDCVADTCGTTGATHGGFVSASSTCARHIRCIARNCKGWGFLATTASGEFINCTADNTSVGPASSGSGFNVTDLTILVNCLSTNNARYGFESNQSATNQFTRLYNCAGYNNTSGDTDTNFTSASNTKNGFVALSAGPYTNTGGGDYSLNSTVGGGAAARAAGYVSAFPGISTNNYLDIGAAQHQDSGGPSTVAIDNQTTIVWPDTGCVGY